LAARGAAAVVIIAGYFGINSWLCSGCRRTCFAAASLSLPLSLVFFDKKMNKEGAVSMVVGLLLMLFYMLKFKFF
jgi:cation/acetate symporter